ncbi:MAG: prolipoprotein diacylglyceryl transferase [bacterium]
MYPYLLKIGSFHLSSYGFMLALSFILGILLAARRAKKQQVDPNIIIDLSFYIIVTAIIGARVYYVLPHLQEFRGNFWRVFAVWEGGLSMYGGVILATVFVLLYMWKKRLPVWKIADIYAPSIALGLGLTRIGCFLRGSCFGKPTNVSWAVVFPPDSPAGMQFPATAIHPTQLYASLYGFVILFALLFLERFKRSNGFTFWLFILIYSISRFLIDFIRYYENSMILTTIWGKAISLNQGISVVLFVVASAMLLKLRWNQLKAESLA